MTCFFIASENASPSSVFAYSPAACARASNARLLYQPAVAVRLSVGRFFERHTERCRAAAERADDARCDPITARSAEHERPFRTVGEFAARLYVAICRIDMRRTALWMRRRADETANAGFDDHRRSSCEWLTDHTVAHRVTHRGRNVEQPRTVACDRQRRAFDPLRVCSRGRRRARARRVRGISTGVCNATRECALTDTSRNSPGDNGARNLRPGPISTSRPQSSAAPTGSMKPPIGDIPTESGSARVNRMRTSRAASNGRKLPTKSFFSSAASMSPTSVAPLG